jgi:hypothetical protein
MGRKAVKRDAAEVIRDCIATRLRMANRVITKVYDDGFRPLGLTDTQMSMLVVAEDRGLIRQSEVGAKLQLDDSTWSGCERTAGWKKWPETMPASIRTG